MNNNLIKDYSVFEEAIIRQCVLDTFIKKVWACWKIITGEAGILLVRINPKNVGREEIEKILDDWDADFIDKKQALNAILSLGITKGLKK